MKKLKEIMMYIIWTALIFAVIQVCHCITSDDIGFIYCSSCTLLGSKLVGQGNFFGGTGDNIMITSIDIYFTINIHDYALISKCSIYTTTKTLL